MPAADLQQPGPARIRKLCDGARNLQDGLFIGPVLGIVEPDGGIRRRCAGFQFEKIARFHRARRKSGRQFGLGFREFHAGQFQTHGPSGRLHQRETGGQPQCRSAAQAHHLSVDPIHRHGELCAETSLPSQQSARLAAFARAERRLLFALAGQHGFHAFTDLRNALVGHRRIQNASQRRRECAVRNLAHSLAASLGDRGLARRLILARGRQEQHPHGCRIRRFLTGGGAFAVFVTGRGSGGT